MVVIAERVAMFSDKQPKPHPMSREELRKLSNAEFLKLLDELLAEAGGL